MSNFDSIPVEEATERFIPTEGSPATLFDVPCSPELIEKLRARGLEYGHLADDYGTATTAAFFKLIPDSPVDRISTQLTSANNEEDGTRIMHRIVTDIFEDQFENNWPEYL